MYIIDFLDGATADVAKPRATATPETKNLSPTAFGFFKPTHHFLSLAPFLLSLERFNIGDLIKVFKTFQSQLCQVALEVFWVSLMGFLFHLSAQAAFSFRVSFAFVVRCFFALLVVVSIYVLFVSFDDIFLSFSGRFDRLEGLFNLQCSSLCRFYLFVFGTYLHCQGSQLLNSLSRIIFCERNLHCLWCNILNSLEGLCVCIEGVVVGIEFGCCGSSMLFFKGSYLMPDVIGSYSGILEAVGD
ncbi:hypothetical protein VNO78_27754 [Psophocarpus tetragonolobus]|uniref:Uncharacterized protein n=1 Tax=Psophocarpus tetragonolobus TaxID=3891 RepID=A0AAN9XBM9_PSOTE